MLSACGGGLEQGQVGFVDGFYGGVVADDPQAVLVARDVLSAGGSAADAAVAAYFALSVVRPSAAGLGGGGACVARSADGRQVQALDFLPVSSKGGTVAVPSNVRGFFALHSKFGRLRWAELVSPAEKIARFGSDASRALVTEFSRLPADKAETLRARASFIAPTGELLRESERMTRFDLAALLGQIRSNGVGSFYNGELATMIVGAFADAGGALERAELRAVRPVWRKPIAVQYDHKTAYFAPAPATGGAVAAGVLAHLIDDDRYDDAQPAQRAAMVGDVYAQTLKALKVNLAGANAAVGAATGFSVVDGLGGAVACVVTMNQPFGTGRVAPGIGMLMAAPTQSDGQMLEIAPVVIAKTNVPELVMAATATNSAASGALLARTVAQTLVAEVSLERAVSDPRVLWDARSGHFVAEKGAQDSALRKGGYPVEGGAALGRVNGIYCPGGLPPHPELCTAVADPRAYGYAIIATN